MQILDRYIYRAVLYGIVIATTVLITLFVFMSFVGELTYVKGGYTALVALKYTVLTNAKMLKDLFPMSALIGTLIGLGGLAGSNELTVMRATGISIRRIAVPVFKVAILVMVVVALFSSYVVPVAEQYAYQVKASALQQKYVLNTRSGIWLKNDNQIFHAAAVDGNRFNSVLIYVLNQGQGIDTVVSADEARYEDRHWVLYKVSRTDFLPQQTRVTNYERLPWKIDIQPDIVAVVTVAPSELSIFDLSDFIDHLVANGQNALRYQVAFWEKIVSPFSTLLMIFMAMPFVFGSLRSVNISTRLLSGTIIGIAFYMANQTSSRLGVVYEVWPFISAAGPTLVVLLILAYYSRRLS